MSRRTTGVRIKPSKWHETLQNVESHQEAYFYQESEAKQSRLKSGESERLHTDESVHRFSNKKDPWGQYQLLEHAMTESFAISSLEEKPSVLESLVRVIQKYHASDKKRQIISEVADELMLNALISAPRAAAELKLKPALRGIYLLAAEWNSDEIWIHMQDPWGAFRRGNFAKSFRPFEAQAVTHGHSGRGLKIISEACTDLYIMSRPSEGTWVAARIDLRLSNVEHEQEPKRLLLDFL